MNKFLIGTALSVLMFSGAAMAEIPAEKGPHGTPPRVEAVLEKLPKEKADLFRTTMEGLKTDRQASREQFKTLRTELEAIMTAPKFDKAAFMAKSKEIAELRDTKRMKFEEAFASIADRYTQEERKMLVDAMPKHGGWHKHDEHSDHNSGAPAPAEKVAE